MLVAVRLVLSFLWLLICAVCGTLYSLVNFRSVNNLHPVAQIFGRYCLPIMGVKLERRGYEKLLRPGPYVIIANHQHNLDVPLYARMVPPRTITIGKREVIWVPAFGLIFYSTGNLFINRKDLEQAKKTYDKARDIMVSQDAHIWLFPEGTRRYGLGLGEFKKGPFHLAVDTGIPLQPIVTTSLKGTVDLSRWKAGNVIIEVLQPIETKGRTVDEVRLESHAAMKAAIARLDAELATR
ncbi:MAG: 1-acylglycerol-3-phosphate O-acyltransferase [Bdellovibrionia bacterium]